ncbi:MAG TPA: S8 family serine peptidase [Arenimonas sp.]|uniref:S8 family serine peptidase n=1 Tax=Arenimonas sp. TaxID=1872635 RepID=UPI002D807D88|nr:S8 family serine peptidase [Arenimonas sp.]HEU0152897.1 S8 family serine peptidase [Arenimonas sp.]
MKKWGAALALVALVAVASPVAQRFAPERRADAARPARPVDAPAAQAAGSARGDAAAARAVGTADDSAPAARRGQAGSRGTDASRFVVMPRTRLPGGGFHYDPALNAGDGVERPAAPVGHRDDAAPGTYIVLFDEPSLAAYRGDLAALSAPPRTSGKDGKRRIDVQSREARDYLGYLQGRQLEMEARMAGVAGRALDVRMRMQHAVNGIVVDMTAEASARVAKLPGVRLVEGYREYLANTDVGPTLIGAPVAWAGSSSQPGGASAVQGEGIVIGMIDSGINFGSPSFAAIDPVDGYVHVNPLGAGVYLGSCAAGGEDVGRCNDKLIGGYDFVCLAPGNQCGATDVREEPGFGDTNGHGSHTASTAGGNRRDVVFGSAQVRISGVAPRANLIAYDACYTNTATGQGLCPNVATVASINQAVADGVDVINYSIGGGAEPWSEATSLAFLDATDAGIFVATSAGNSGPGPNTMGHLEPWTSSTAASQHGRAGFAFLMQVTGPEPVPAPLQPIVVTPGSGGVAFSATLPGTTRLFISPGIATTSDGCNAFAADAFTGGIVLIRRGTCSFSIKANNAAAAGAVAVVIANNQAGGLVPSVPGTTVPVFSVTEAEGNALASFGNANPANTTAQIAFPAVGVPNVVDALASFSSRGPAGNFDLVKPDITAPGVDILATLAGTTITGSESLVGVISGTSMASPHNAGAAALIRQARPTWTVAEIKSALLMTATPQVYLEDEVSPADPFARGSGRIRLERAIRAGLVLDESKASYLAANPGTGGLTHTLNLPSMARANCAPTCQFVRTFRNPGTSGGLWSLGVSGLAGSVDSPLIWVPAGTSRTVTVTIDTSAIPANNAWNFGELVLTRIYSGAQSAADSTLRLPIGVTVAPPVLSVPGLVSASVAVGNDGSTSFDIGNTGGSPLVYTATTTGNAAATVYRADRGAVNSGFRSTIYTDPATAGFNAQFAADDFQVVASTQVTGLSTEGFVVSGAAFPGAAVDLTWSIYPDLAGVPAGNPATNPGAAVWSYTAAANAPGVGTAAGFLTLNLAAAGQNLVLPPGTYWLVVSTRGTFANRWARFGSATGSGSFMTISIDLANAGAWAPNVAFAGLNTTITGQVACGAPWLGALSPASGSVAPGASQATGLALASSALAAATYGGFVCVNSNDPVSPAVAVPVRLTVTP